MLPTHTEMAKLDMAYQIDRYLQAAAKSAYRSEIAQKLIGRAQVH